MMSTIKHQLKELENWGKIELEAEAARVRRPVKMKDYEVNWPNKIR